MTTKAEREHLGRVADLGCIACRMQGLGWQPAQIHHLRTGMGMGQRNDHFHVIPLCSRHHNEQHPDSLSIHRNRRAFQAAFGTELELWDSVRALLEMGETG